MHQNINEPVTPAVEIVGRGFSRDRDGDMIHIPDAIRFAPTQKREFQNPDLEQHKRAWEEDNQKRIARASSKVRRIERPELTVEQFKDEIDTLLSETEKVSAVSALIDTAGLVARIRISKKPRVSRQHFDSNPVVRIRR
jgi:hypothetical protein